jgi:hypothetical protein
MHLDVNAAGLEFPIAWVSIFVNPVFVPFKAEATFLACAEAIWRLPGRAFPVRPSLAETVQTHAMCRL